MKFFVTVYDNSVEYPIVWQGVINSAGVVEIEDWLESVIPDYQYTTCIVGKAMNFNQAKQDMIDSHLLEEQ